MIVAFEGLLKAKQSVYDFVLIIVDKPFEVVGRGRLVAFNLSAGVQILEGQVVPLLLVVDDPPFLNAHMSHVSIAANSQGLDGFLEMSQFLFADPLPDVRKAFCLVDVDGFCEILQCMIIVVLF